MRLLFDTNVLFAAFVSHGACAGLYEECLQRAEILVSEAILKELGDKLRTKAKLPASDIRSVLQAVRADAEVVKGYAPLAEPVCRDHDDDHILAAAVAGNADVLVTGDQDLLVLKKYRSIPILTPRDTLALIDTT